MAHRESIAPAASRAARAGRWAYPALHALLVAAAALVYLPDRIAVDDAFITFRYAENLLAGHGLVYNVGEAFLGTSTPLFALALALVAWVSGASVFQAVVVLHVAALVALGLLAWGLFRGHVLRPVGLLLPYLVMSNKLVIYCFGMESLLFAVVGMAVIHAYHRGRPIACGVAASALCLLRPDGIFLALPLLILAWVDKRWIIRRSVITCAAFAAVWITFTWTQGVGLIPDTVGAKLGQAMSGLWPESFGERLVWFMIPRKFGLWTGAVVVALFWAGARRDRLGLAVGAWLLVSVAGFTLAGVPSYPWYYVPLVVQGSFLSAWLVVRTASPVLERIEVPKVRTGARYAAVAVAIGVVAAAGAGWGGVRDHLRRDAFDPRIHPYYRVGRRLDKHAPKDAKIAAIEVGMIGYYGRRYVVDFLGLVTPGLADQVAHRLNIDEALIRHRPDYLLLGTQLDGHSSVIPQYVVRGYDPIFQYGRKILLKRKPRDEAALARRVEDAVRAVVPEGGAAAIYFGDFPMLLDFETFRGPAEAALPGVRFTSRPPADDGVARFVLCLDHDDAMRLVPFRDDMVVTYDRAALATWSRNALSVKPGAEETLFQVERPWGSLSKEVDLRGPIRRIRLRLRVFDLAGRRGAEGRIHFTCGAHKAGDTWPWFGFTIRANPAWHDLVIHFPAGGGIRQKQKLHALRIDLGDMRGRLAIESLSLERY